MTDNVATQKITDSSEKTAAAVGAAIFFAPHFMNKKTDFVTFYMRQNFGLWVAYMILYIIMRIVIAISFANMNTIASASETRSGGFLVSILNIFTIVLTLAMCAIFFLSIFLIYKAYKGEKYEVPYLLKYTNLLISKIPALQSFFSPKN